MMHANPHNDITPELHMISYRKQTLVLLILLCGVQNILLHVDDFRFLFYRKNE